MLIGSNAGPMLENDAGACCLIQICLRLLCDTAPPNTPTQCFMQGTIPASQYNSASSPPSQSQSLKILLLQSRTHTWVYREERKYGPEFLQHAAS